MDAETLLLPDRFTLPGLAAGIVFAGLRPGLESGVWTWSAGLRAAGLSLLAAVAAAAALLLIAGAYWLARRRMGMGMGDVKLLAMLAAWLGLRQTALVLFLAVIVGALYGLGTILFNRRQNKEDNEDQLPPGLMPVPVRYHAKLGRPLQHISRPTDAGLVSAILSLGSCWSS